MRSARTENPGRLVLVDTDGAATSAAALPAALDGTASNCPCATAP
ncbi:hypothetical protein STENM223S_04754 [Streptomyces tendae]